MAVSMKTGVRTHGAPLTLVKRGLGMKTKVYKKRSKHNIVAKYEKIYFQSLDVDIADIPAKIRANNSIFYFEAFKRTKTTQDFNRVMELLEHDIMCFPKSTGIRRLLLIHRNAIINFQYKLQK